MKPDPDHRPGMERESPPISGKQIPSRREKPRVLTGELLDSLPHDDPEARRSRADLRRINFLMGTFPWVLRSLRSLGALDGEAHLVEVEAGDGGLARFLHRQCPGLRYTAIDLAPEPPGWPGDGGFRWRQGDALELLGETGGDVLLANLFLHHFDDAGLARLGGCLSGFSSLLASEPVRRRRYHALAWTGRALGFNRVTRHDIHASIDAGFLGDDLAGALRLDDSEWDLEVMHTAMGAHRTLARRVSPWQWNREDTQVGRSV